MGDLDELREKARKMLALAIETADPGLRGLLLDIASQYAEMAARANSRQSKPDQAAEG